jgi:hypothetical protein
MIVPTSGVFSWPNAGAGAGTDWNGPICGIWPAGSVVVWSPE